MAGTDERVKNSKMFQKFAYSYFTRFRNNPIFSRGIVALLVLSTLLLIHLESPKQKPSDTAPFKPDSEIAEIPERPEPSPTPPEFEPIPDVPKETSRSDDPHFLIVIPCYKQENFIEKAVSSVHRQMYPGWTMVITDDGTPDKKCQIEATEVLDRLNISSERAKAVWKPNSGLSDTRSFGLIEVNKFRWESQPDPEQQFICFLDADDEITPEYLQKAVEIVKADPDVDLIYADQLFSTGWTWDVPSFRMKTAIKSGPLPAMTIIRSELFYLLGGFPKRNIVGNEDYAFWLMALGAGAKAIKIPEVGSLYTFKSESMMRSKAYQFFAMPMLQASTPAFFHNWILAYALHQIHCHLETQQLGILQDIFENDPHDCETALWMMLYYFRRERKSNGNLSSQVVSRLTQNVTKCLEESEGWGSGSPKNGQVPIIRTSTAVAQTVISYKGDLGEVLKCGDSEKWQVLFDGRWNSSVTLTRVEARLGAFVSSHRSQKIMRQHPSPDFQLLALLPVEDYFGKDLLKSAKYLPSVNSIVSTLKFRRNDTVRSLSLKFASIIDDTIQQHGEIDAIYVNAGGREQLVFNALKIIDQAWTSKVGMVILHYDRILLDKFGPLTGPEFVTRTFGDAGYTYFEATEGVTTLRHNQDFHRFLFSALPTKFVFTNPDLPTPSEESLLKKPDPIPRIVHFVFGMSKNKKDRVFQFFHYIAVKSAHEKLRPEKIFLHYSYPPLGPWWRKASPYITMNRVRDVQEIFGNPVRNFAHKADVIRLEMLKEHGGIYLDLDVWIVNDFGDILDGRDDFIIGEEGYDGNVGLCNAVLIAKSNSRFLTTWYEKYKDFSDKRWNEFSVELPTKIAKELPSHVRVMPHNKFFWPMWDSPGLARLYLSTDCPWLETSLTVHLWASKSNSLLHELSESSIWHRESCIFQLARQILYGNDKKKEAPAMDSSSAISHGDFGVELREITFAVVVASFTDFETVRRTWGLVALSMGADIVFCTTDAKLHRRLFYEVSNSRSQKQSLREGIVDLIYINQTSTDTTNATRKASRPSSSAWNFSSTFRLMRRLKRLYPTSKWYVKADIKVWIRPEILRQVLAGFDHSKIEFLGLPRYFYGKIEQLGSEYLRLLHPFEGFFALSASAVTFVLPQEKKCSYGSAAESLGLALCFRDVIGVSISPLPLAFHDSRPEIGTSQVSVLYSVSPERMVMHNRNMYGERSVVVPTVNSNGIQTLSSLGANVKTYLGDPDDFRHHDPLASQGAVGAIAQEGCFATKSVCGWPDISRSDCLHIGCCFNDKFTKHSCFLTTGTPGTEKKYRGKFNDGQSHVHRICTAKGSRQLVIHANGMQNVSHNEVMGDLFNLVKASLRFSLPTLCGQRLLKCVKISHAGDEIVDGRKRCEHHQVEFSSKKSCIKSLPLFCRDSSLEILQHLIRTLFGYVESFEWSHRVSLEEFNGGTDFKWLLTDGGRPSSRGAYACRNYDNGLHSTVVCTIGEARIPFSLPKTYSRVEKSYSLLIHRGDRLRPGVPLISKDFSTFLVLQDDNNQCLYRGSDPRHNKGAIECSRNLVPANMTVTCNILEYHLKINGLHAIYQCGDDAEKKGMRMFGSTGCDVLTLSLGGEFLTFENECGNVYKESKVAVHKLIEAHSKLSVRRSNNAIEKTQDFDWVA